MISSVTRATLTAGIGDRRNGKVRESCSATGLTIVRPMIHQSTAARQQRFCMCSSAASSALSACHRRSAVNSPLPTVRRALRSRRPAGSQGSAAGHDRRFENGAHFLHQGGVAAARDVAGVAQRMDAGAERRRRTAANPGTPPPRTRRTVPRPRAPIDPCSATPPRRRREWHARAPALPLPEHGHHVGGVHQVDAGRGIGVDRGLGNEHRTDYLQSCCSR